MVLCDRLTVVDAWFGFQDKFDGSKFSLNAELASVRGSETIFNTSHTAKIVLIVYWWVLQVDCREACCHCRAGTVANMPGSSPMG